MANPSGPTLTTFQSLAVASQFGITLVISVVLGYFAGHWLDDRFGTSVLFTLIGVLLGLVAASTNIVRLYRATLRKSQADADASTTDSTRSADHGTPDG